jgi:hypothetical protein
MAIIVPLFERKDSRNGSLSPKALPPSVLRNGSRRWPPGTAADDDAARMMLASSRSAG